jgi:rhodanese-related sulfurtransferase
MSFLGRLLGADAADATDVDVHAAHAMHQQEGALLIDVREPHEFRHGHAKGARNIPLGQLAQRIAEIRKDCTVLVICQSGNRSKVGCHILRRQEFADVRNVSGGTHAWQRSGLPLHR